MLAAAFDFARAFLGLGQSLSFTEQMPARRIDEQILFQALADIALVDRVRYTASRFANSERGKFERTKAR